MKNLLPFLFFILLPFHLIYAQTDTYRDLPYIQDYSIKYYSSDSSLLLSDIASDRNGVTGVLSSKGILRPQGGAFQYPGTLQPDKGYEPLSHKRLLALEKYQNQFVYLDAKKVFSNAFAGKWNVLHGMAHPKLLCVGKDFTSVVSDGKHLKVFKLDQLLFETNIGKELIIDIKFDPLQNQFLLLSKSSISSLSTESKKIKTVFTGTNLTCFDVDKHELYIGTNSGYFILDAGSFQEIRPLTNNLPVPDISTIASINGKLWFGTALGAFMLKEDGKFNYYYGERWFPNNKIIQICAGEGNNVLILTQGGLGDIHFDPMTLEQKALVYERQVRLRHIRYGFNCDISTLSNGDLATYKMGHRASDNLWTSMYLASQLFRYKVTGSQEALQNCLESFEAMERLFEITGMEGYFARGFERRREAESNKSAMDQLPAKDWAHAKDEEWEWHGTTSSDQTVGQMFSLTLLAEYMEGDVKKRAINLIDKLMTNIINNDWYLIDFDGKPTLWGKWNPEYVNGFPTNVGDRKLNSSNIIGYLQTAYHFTGKEIYKEKAHELMYKHGYLENLLRPMSQIGKAEKGADDWAKMLSEGWNHSDDEMYFLAYWCLYPYALDPKLKAQYKTAIQQHWELERPEKDGLWNMCYGMTGAKEFDLQESIWYLKEFPLDMIEWQVVNSHRKDITFLKPNFRGQTTAEILPPDERPGLKHNGNLFKLDRQQNGTGELSAGHSFLLPYWMGRFIGAIGKGE